MAVSAMMVSCGDPNGTQCWEMTAKYKTGQTSVWYFYGSGDEADTQLQMMVGNNGVESATRKSAGKSKSDCVN